MRQFRISELGRLVGLSRSALLYYDRIGLLHSSGRSDAAYRLYTEDDLARLERITFFRDAGLSLIDIAQLLDATGDGGGVIEGRLQQISHEITTLKAQQRLLAATLRTVTAGHKVSGLDGDLWSGLQVASGLGETALKQWHIEFERRSPQAHHDFLVGLGLTEKEALQVRMLTKNIEDNTVSMRYFFELFEGLPRQGPGCREATLNALELLTLPSAPRVLDIGCGSGMQTQILAKELKTQVLAIDNHRPVLERLERAALAQGLPILTREMSMIDMPFDEASFDLLWAEGSIFIIGLERGLKDFFTYLKPGGYLAFTEMCWTADDHPVEAQDYFDSVYPDIRGVDQVRELARDAGYTVIGDFKLPDSAWWDDYYTPMLSRIEILRSKNAGVAEAEAVYANLERESHMHRQYGASYGYVFFVLQKP